jgi:hypothetical protein
MNGEKFIEGLRRKLKERGIKGTDRELAGHLGITVQGLYHWRNREEITVRQMVGLLERVEAAAEEKAKGRFESNAIRPIVEFFKLAPTDSRDSARVEIFRVRDGADNEHPYLKGLRGELEKYRGIYIFHDSRGRALYAGKTRRQTLWKEINSAFNRDRKDLQKIRRVDHPERRQDFRTSDEMRRQIRLRSLPLYEIATYLSAYKVSDGLIGELESLLIRSFPNDLLNARMENFRWQEGHG